MKTVSSIGPTVSSSIMPASSPPNGPASLFDETGIARNRTRCALGTPHRRVRSRGGAPASENRRAKSEWSGRGRTADTRIFSPRVVVAKMETASSCGGGFLFVPRLYTA
jgi:hypothetical protein